MAIYQFVIELIPEIWAINNNYNAELLFDSWQYDLSAPWSDYKIPNDLICTITKFLPRSKSWHQNLMIWGNEERSDIQIWKNDSFIESIKIRIDVRESKEEKLIIDIVSWAKELGCVFFLPESRQIINPSCSLLREVLDGSAAAQYAINPTKYLSDKISKDKMR